MKQIFIFVAIISCFYGCDKLFPDDNLTLKRVDYNGNELRVDGYYHRFNENEQHPHTVIMFLYRNGIVLSCGSYPSLELNIVEAELVKTYPDIRKNKDGWGVFSITNNQIVIEQWNAPTGISLPTIKRKGYIENDSTFHIIESYFSDINKTYYDEMIYHFKQFDNKPDSTNVFIK
jgi:hypothetical protein